MTKHIGFCFCYTIYGARMHVKNVFDFKRDDGCHMGLAWFMYYNASFNNISAISWRLVLLVEKTGVPLENNLPVAIHWQTLSHNVVSSTPRPEPVWNSRFGWWYALIAHVVVDPYDLDYNDPL
jgi:hypothetical protein